jgi:hypothetical protein
MRSNFTRLSGLFLAGLAAASWSRPALAYIDPGVTALLAQGLFTFIFGTLAAWILAPWQYIKRLFGFSKDTTAGKPDADDASGPH